MRPSTRVSVDRMCLAAEWRGGVSARPRVTVPKGHYESRPVAGKLLHRPCRDGLSLQWKIVQPRFQTLAEGITGIGSTPFLGSNRHAQINQPFQIPDIDIFRIDSRIWRAVMVIAQRNAERRRTISVKLKRGRLTSTTIH